ncbi:MAG: NAD(P)-dependent oxidoreductase [Deltaproteobacteria bacterium]|nr:NAD(P)-dependent oxidoreductase [Deltaproteobacteria bacterium]
MKLRVLVTGAEGFIGRHLLKSLKTAGHEVYGISRSDADITDLDSLLRLSRDTEVLVHLAFPASPAFRREQPLKALQVAAAGTTNSILLAQRCKASHYVLASSGKIYGKPNIPPVSEDHPLNPGAFLGRLKNIQEMIVQAAMNRADNLSVTSLRLFNVYGPGCSEEFLISKLISGFQKSGRITLGELDHRRDWIHVRDACNAFLFAIQAPSKQKSFQPLNVGTGSSTSAREIFDMLCSISGKHPEMIQDPSLLRRAEPEQESADCQRLVSLGWNVEMSLVDGLKDTWAGLLP